MAASTSAAGAMMSTDAMTYQTEAEGHRDDAKMAYDGEAVGDKILSATAAAMMAEEYADKAVEAAGEHVLALFTQANAYDITADMYDTDRDTVTKTAAKLREEETARVGAALTTAVMDRGTDEGGTVAWLAADDEPSVTLTGVTAGAGEDDISVDYEADGPGAFKHRFSISRPTTDTDTSNSQLLLFSDKEKQIAAVTGVEAKRVDNEEVGNRLSEYQEVALRFRQGLLRRLRRRWGRGYARSQWAFHLSRWRTMLGDIYNRR